jgi:excisionase family DNA binding protein
VLLEVRPRAFTAERGDAVKLLYTKREAAELLSVSVDFFEDHVQPDLRLVRKGRLVLIPHRELERWIDANAARTLDAA